MALAGRAGVAVTVTLFLGTPAEMPAQEVDAEEGRELGELVTDRPDVTESTSIVARHWLQVESGASLTGEEGGTRTLSAPGSLLRFGLSRRVEARLGWDGVQSVDVEDGDAPLEVPPGPNQDPDLSGAADAEASVKVLLVERSGARPDLALLPAVSLPVGHDDFSSGAFDPGLKALAGNDVTDRVTWAANAGVAWPTEEGAGGDSRPRLLSWSVSTGIGLTDRLAGFVEYFGEDPGGAPAGHALDAGLTFLASPHVQLDASGGFGLDEHAPEWFAGGGLSFRLGL